MDIEFIRRVVAAAEPGALRTALYQATGDPELADMELVHVPVRRGANVSTTIAPQYLPSLHRKAVEFICSTLPTFVPEPPSEQTVHRLMEFTLARPVSEDEYQMWRSSVAFEEITHLAKWTDDQPQLPPGFSVAIIGAGFSGLGVAVQLTRLGIPITIYERRSEIGGVWSINKYPDARVDTHSRTYEYSFVKRHPWREHFPRQTEVREYLEHVARDFGIYDKIMFGHDLVSAHFDENASRWDLDVVVAGEHHHRSANVVISAAGLFATPRDLDYAGMTAFKGQVVHTTHWASDINLEGKRVAVIGNGSTGVQVLASVAKDAEQVYVFQRTPQWISPRERYGEPVPEELAWLFENMPYYWNWARFTAILPAFGNRELMTPDPDWQATGGFFNKRNDALRQNLIEYIETQLSGRPDLIEKVTPSYAPMARRMVVDNGWYRAISRPNVELVTDSISPFTSSGIVTSDGRERDVDFVVSATGFSVSKYLYPAEYVGRNDVHLSEQWSRDGGPRAYLGMTIPNFPNLFVMYGPNSQSYTGFGLPVWIEIWSKYIAQALIDMLEHGYRSVEVRQEVFEAYNTELDAESARMIWLDPDSKDVNYYVNEFGRQQVNAPWDAPHYYRLVATPKPDDFILRR